MQFLSVSLNVFTLKLFIMCSRKFIMGFYAKSYRENLDAYGFSNLSPLLYLKLKSNFILFLNANPKANCCIT